MRLCLGILLALILLKGALAEPLKITVQTFPPGARMTNQFGEYLGETGSPVAIDWDRSKGPLEVQFELDGHESVTRTITYRELDQPIYPERGVVELPADSYAVAAVDILRYRWPVVLAGCLLLVGGAWWGRRTLGASRSSFAHPKFGRYQALDVIGRGGTSEVFLATSEGLAGAESVALKVLHEKSGTARQRFEREVKVCLALQHPNLMQLYDWGTHTDDRLYLVCELLEGETLRDRLSAGPLDAAQTTSVVSAVGSALSYLHSEGVAHRDIKPGNIFLCRNGRTKLLDLGIAKTDEVAPITQTGVAIGTPHYMSPEQIQGKAGESSDQYSLGVLTFEMLTGRRPFEANDITELYKKHLEEQPPGLPPEAGSPLTEQIIHRMMAKLPKNRYPSVAEAVESLTESLSTDSELGEDTHIG